MSSDFEIVEYENGSFTLKEISSGQAMHSRVGPWAEAQQVYIEQSGILERLEAGLERGWVLYDVGMGLATNALAAIEAWGNTPTQTRATLRIVSFESRLEGLRAALSERSGVFSFLDRHRFAVETVLDTGCWTSEDGRLTWEVREGDFRSHLSDPMLPCADIVFYDFYDPKTCPDLWSIQLFEKLIKKCTDQLILCTYAAATPVRCALLLAGFRVGQGVKTWAKAETTMATLSIGSKTTVPSPLNEKWLEKWEKSSRQIPYGGENYTKIELKKLVYSQPQFQNV